MLGGIRMSSVAPMAIEPAASSSEYPWRRISGMAIFDITEAAATLAPDMAPKMPQANTVAMARQPLMRDIQLAAAVYRSRARPLEAEKKAISMNIGIVVRA